jgi:transglutaminase-like putative cysteine protease
VHFGHTVSYDTSGVKSLSYRKRFAVILAFDKMAAQSVVLERDATPQGLSTPTSVVTEQTVRKMCEHIRAALQDPIVQDVAARSTARSVSPADKLAALWLWVKHHVKFVHDDVLTRQLFNEADHFELLISPPVLLRMKEPRGDCDDFTMLIDALCLAAGFDVGIVTLACDRRRPREYSHVYGCAWLPGVMCPMDVSHGKYPGWEVPRRDVQRKTIWSIDGKMLADELWPASADSAQSGGGLGDVPPGLPSLPGPPAINTGIPLIGTIDFQNPLEWLTLGGAAASLLLINDTTGKIAGAAGFIGVRYILQQIWGTW